MNFSRDRVITYL